MTDVEVKLYESNNGKKINVVNHFSSSYYTVSKIEGDESIEITPNLNSVTVDLENEIILCRKNFTINNVALVSVYFYINFNGDVVSLAFSNISDSLFDIKLSNEFDKYPFETFDLCINNLKKVYANLINSRIDRNIEIGKKLALVKRTD